MPLNYLTRDAGPRYNANTYKKLIIVFRQQVLSLPLYFLYQSIDWSDPSPRTNLVRQITAILKNQ